MPAMDTQTQEDERARTDGADLVSEDAGGGDESGLRISPERFINREISWLRFNMRVLEEVRNEQHPVLERLKFLSISGNNLDEFFMVRVAGLAGQKREGIEQKSADGLTPAAQLAEVQELAGLLMREQDEQWALLVKELSSAGVHLLAPEELNDGDLAWIDQHFLEQIFPVLTPLAIDPAHPFPFIPNKGFTLVLSLRRAVDGRLMDALLPIPHQLDRFIRLPDAGGKSSAGARYLSLEHFLLMHIPRLFLRHDCFT